MSTNKAFWPNVLVATVILAATQVRPAYAYVDPGSISVVVTAILGGIAAVGYTARAYLARVKQFFSRKKPTE